MNQREQLTQTKAQKSAMVFFFIFPSPKTKWLAKCWGQDRHLIDTNSHPKYEWISNVQGNKIKATNSSFLLLVQISTRESQPFTSPWHGHLYSQTDRFPTHLSSLYCLALVNQSAPFLLKLINRWDGFDVQIYFRGKFYFLDRQYKKEERE